MHSYAQPTTPTLAFLADLTKAQQASAIFAFELDSDEQQLARLRQRYARLRAEWAIFLDLFDEPALDIELRAADSRQLTLRLPMRQTGDAYAALRDVLSDNLRELEREIVHHLRSVAEDEALRQQRPDQNDLPGLSRRAAILALCAPSDPALPTAGSEWLARAGAAEALEEVMRQEHGLPEAHYGREILWHPLFPAEYVGCVGRLPLYEVAEFHEALPSWCNQRRPLDGHDYAYLADVLREALASQPTELATLRLTRALAWVEQATPGWPTAAPPRPVAAPAPATAPSAYRQAA